MPITATTDVVAGTATNPAHMPPTAARNATDSVVGHTLSPTTGQLWPRITQK